MNRTALAARLGELLGGAGGASVGVMLVRIQRTCYLQRAPNVYVTKGLPSVQLQFHEHSHQV